MPGYTTESCAYMDSCGGKNMAKQCARTYGTLNTGASREPEILLNTGLSRQQSRYESSGKRAGFSYAKDLLWQEMPKEPHRARKDNP